MIDIESKKVIDLLDSREIPEVTEWLKTFPNLEVISRDGSISYASAIRQAHPNAIQVSDRFHLLKNLTDAAKKQVVKMIGSKFRIAAAPSHYNGTYEEGYWADADNLKADAPERIHTANAAKKQIVVNQVQELSIKGYSISAIAKELGIAYSTAKRYRAADFNPESKGYGENRDSKLKPYTDEIDSLLSKRHTFREIEEIIRRQGYDGSSSTIRMYATRERKRIKAAEEKRLEHTELIERKWVVSLLYKPLEKVKKITQVQVNQIIKEYPLIGRIYDIIQSFKEILFAKNAEDLELWIEEASLLKIDEINSFIGGIIRDVEAVKNAIRYEYNNGLAEGSVNKLKVIKRIMYGRNSFILLRNKLLLLEVTRKIN